MAVKTTTKSKDHAWFFYVGVVALSAIYVYLSISAPLSPSAERLGITSWMLTIIYVTFLIPYVSVWFLAVQSIINLKRLQQLQNAPLNKGYGLMSLGLTFLILGMISTAFISLAGNYNRENTSMVVTVNILNNYIQILFPLLGFFILFQAAKISANNTQKKFSEDDFVSLIVTLILAVLYTALVFTNPSRQVSLDPVLQPTYYISDPLIVATIIIPSAISWFYGIRASYVMGVAETETRQPASTVALLGTSFWFIVVASILLQALDALGTERFLQVGRGLTLALIYLFLVAICFGYWQLNRAIKKLIKNSDTKKVTL